MNLDSATNIITLGGNGFNRLNVMMNFNFLCFFNNLYFIRDKSFRIKYHYE